MAKLELRNLNKTYNPKTVPVKDISLDVADDEFLTLVGPSGCGKSTTLRMISGLEQPTRGRVYIGDRDVTHVPPGDRNVAMVFQSYAIYPHMDVRENISAGLKLRKLPEAEIDRRVAQVADKLGVTHLLDRKPKQLSGGQRQRVALGRALVRNPDAFLLDEPLSNLDALLREQVRAELKQIFAGQPAPVVYVTHDQTEAMTLSTKVAVLYDGNVQQLDSPDRIYSHPANRFVAGFIGSPQMNLMTVPCEENYALLGDFKIPLPPKLTPPPEVTLGIRPEHIELVGHEPPEDDYVIEGKIFLVENLGMSNLLSLHLPNDNNRTADLRALIPSGRTWSGDRVKLSLSPRLIHWYDAQSGDRIPT